MQRQVVVKSEEIPWYAKNSFKTSQGKGKALRTKTLQHFKIHSTAVTWVN